MCVPLETKLQVTLTQSLNSEKNILFQEKKTRKRHRQKQRRDKTKTRQIQVLALVRFWVLDLILLLVMSQRHHGLCHPYSEKEKARKVGRKKCLSSCLCLVFNVSLISRSPVFVSCLCLVSVFAFIFILCLLLCLYCPLYFVRSL